MTLILFLSHAADFRRQAPFSFIFQGTDRPKCCEELVPYAVTDDNIAEPDEILTISISSSSNITVNFIVQQINVTIIDNDGEYILLLWYIIGASLSEPHIDHDNVPRRGECLYVSMYLAACSVCQPQCSREHAY